MSDKNEVHLSYETPSNFNNMENECSVGSSCQTHTHKHNFMNASNSWKGPKHSDNSEAVPACFETRAALGDNLHTAAFLYLKIDIWQN